jgi:hypothetical protein
MFRGGRPSLSPTGQNFPDEDRSISKMALYVKQKSEASVEDSSPIHMPPNLAPQNGQSTGAGLNLLMPCLQDLTTHLVSTR